MSGKRKGRSPNGSGSIYKHEKIKNGKKCIWYEGRVTVGRDTKTGKPLYKRISGTDVDDVRKRMTKIMIDVDEGTFQSACRYTLEDWIEIWLQEFVLTTVKPYTYDSYKSTCTNYIIPSLGKTKITELKTLQIQKFYSSLITEKGLSPKTVKNIHGILHRTLEAAVRVDILKDNPTKKCDVPRARRKEIAPIDTEKFPDFIKAIQGTRFEAIYFVTLFTGLRQGEVLGLTWDCVDFERDCLTINKQLTKTHKVGGEYTLSSTKTDRGRVVVCAPSVMETLRRWKVHQEGMAEEAGSLWDNKWNLVFTNEFGRYLCHVTVYKDFKRIVNEIGLGGERFHDLRHSYALVCLEAGDDIKTLQSNLGHATSSFTLDVYGSVSQRMKRQSADNMERFINTLEKEINPDPDPPFSDVKKVIDFASIVENCRDRKIKTP